MTSYCKTCDIHINDLARHKQSQTHTKIQKSYERGHIDAMENTKTALDILNSHNKTLLKDNDILRDAMKRLRRSKPKIIYRVDPFQYTVVLKEIIELFQANMSKMDYTEIEATKNNTKHDLECSICIQKIHKKSEMIRTDCHHRFHVLCMVKWCETCTSTDISCPLCRRKIYKQGYDIKTLFEVRRVLELLQD